MLTDPENYSYEYTKELIEGIDDVETQRWACLLYGTGCRVSESKLIEVKDITKQTKSDGNTYLVVRCPVLKKHDGKLHFRQAPIRMDETWLVKPILALKKLMVVDGPHSPLVVVHRATIFRKLIKELGINPHGFRKLRATHLATKFNFNEVKLVKFFNWADFRPAGAYAKANLEDIMY